MQEIKLETKKVGSLSGNFYVPSYQRGYRWGESEVNRLLDDIYANGANSYCIQPVVVRNNGDCYELIDGQQRLTTLYLIYRYMYNASGGFLDEPKFTLAYETRVKSAGFLKDIDMSLREDNIDFWHICNAYETIERWFSSKDKKSTLTNINTYFDEQVKMIWYEVGESEDAIDLFTRLNIGKIPLTSAELVKAMFLSRDTNKDMTRERQEEISLQWDNIEKELHNESLWWFLTNNASFDMRTRIDLILNLISGRPDDCREKYYTFFAFDKMREEIPLENIWKEIQHTFLLLKDWYEDHELYHKIGYLIASQSMSLNDVYEMSKNKTKSMFKCELDECIRESVNIGYNYADLSYEKAGDYSKISRLLLLFNVESIRQIDEKAQRFPFDKFKEKNSWSLEHIHAQNSEGMKKQEDWKEWLRLHISSVKNIEDTETIVNEMEDAIVQTKLDRRVFESLQERVVGLLSVEGNVEYLHSISNLALLNSGDNAALNNSTFDVKRNEIIEMDKRGKYIPFCTKMAFLKYYTPSECNQLHFWGQADRNAYVDAMNTVLKEYLTEKITIEKEG